MSHQPPISSIPSLNNNNNNNKQNQTITIKLSKPIRQSSSYHLIYFEWSLLITLGILFFSIIEQDWNNTRIVIYSLLFMFLQTLRETSKYLQCFDPLQLSALRQLIKVLSLLIQANLTYLLFRILLNYHNVYSFLLFLHYSIIGVISFQKSKKNYEISFPSEPNSQILFQTLTPFILFFLSILVTSNTLNQLSIIQFLFLAFTLFLTVQIKLLLINKQCFLFGWERHQGKPHLVFNKYLAIKKIIFAVCAIVALQNMLFIIPSIGQTANSTMLLSLLLGGYVMWMYQSSRKGINRQISK